MKDIYQILREKEQAIARVRREVEALRFCAPMLSEAGELSLNPPAGQTANRRPAETETRPAGNPYQN